LAQVSRKAPIRNGLDEPMARAVAEQICALLRQPMLTLRLERIRQSLRLKLFELLP
jgi:hypothetical protein